MIGTVKEVLPKEAMDFENIQKIKDKQVMSKHILGWKGPHKNVYAWWTLEDGTRLGWNESPSRGWSFVTMSKTPRTGSKSCKVSKTSLKNLVPKTFW